MENNDTEECQACSQMVQTFAKCEKHSNMGYEYECNICHYKKMFQTKFRGIDCPKCKQGVMHEKRN